KGRKQGDPGKNHHGGVKGRHFSASPITGEPARGALHHSSSNGAGGRAGGGSMAAPRIAIAPRRGDSSLFRPSAPLRIPQSRTYSVGAVRTRPGGGNAVTRSG